VADIQIDEGALDDLLYSPDGPVGVDMERRAENVEAMAKELASSVGAGVMWPEIVRTRLRGVPRYTPGRLWMFGPPSGHRSSLPGAPPAIDTGMLRDSIRHEPGPEDPGPSWDIGTDLYYSRFVEVGTSYMAPRPYLRPALVAAGSDNPLHGPGF